MQTPGPEHRALAVVGPTASGKSQLAIDLAEAFDGEIVNYDSVQLFRGLDIGTAKPSSDDLQRVVHHLIDVLDPDEVTSAGEYQKRARPLLAEIAGRRKLPILVGGTGLYLRAVLEGLFEGPARSDSWRERLGRLADAQGRTHMHRVLARLDPETASRIGVRDTQKVIRALEVRFRTGQSLSRLLKDGARQPIEGFVFSVIGVNPPREALYCRIEERVDRMFEAGLVEEVQALLREGVSPRAHAFRAIGYRRVLEYLDDVVSLDEAMMLTKRDTRRYAKRQMTWFKRQHNVAWFDGFGNEEANKKRIRQFVNHFFGDFAPPT